MKRSRSQEVSEIVVAKSDLNAIWKSLVQVSLADGTVEKPKIKVFSAGAITTETEEDTIFDNDVLDLMKTVSLEFQYSNYRNGKRVSVNLREGYLPSAFSVSGNDTAWVDSTFEELRRVFGAVRPQSQMFKKYQWAITTALALAIGWSIQLILSTLFASSTPPPTGPAPSWVIFLRNYIVLIEIIGWSCVCLSGLFPAMAVTRWVAALWPAVEFDLGPEHLKTKKSLRARLGVIIGLIVLPIAIAGFQRFVFGWK